MRVVGWKPSLSRALSTAIRSRNRVSSASVQIDRRRCNRPGSSCGQAMFLLQRTWCSYNVRVEVMVRFEEKVRMFSHRVQSEHRDKESGGQPYAATRPPRWPLCALWLSSSAFVKPDHREGEEQQPMDNKRPATFKLALPILTPHPPSVAFGCIWVPMRERGDHGAGREEKVEPEAQAVDRCSTVYFPLSTLSAAGRPPPPPPGHSVPFGDIEEAVESGSRGAAEPAMLALSAWHHYLLGALGLAVQFWRAQIGLGRAKFQLLRAKFQLFRDIWGTFSTRCLT